MTTVLWGIYWHGFQSINGIFAHFWIWHLKSRAKHLQKEYTRNLQINVVCEEDTTSRIEISQFEQGIFTSTCNQRRLFCKKKLRFIFTTWSPNTTHWPHYLRKYHIICELQIEMRGKIGSSCVNERVQCCFWLTCHDTGWTTANLSNKDPNYVDNWFDKFIQRHYKNLEDDWKEVNNWSNCCKKKYEIDE